MIRAALVQDERELRQILELQAGNLARNLSPDQVAAEGFVTVEHSLDALKRMHALAPSVIAKDGEAWPGTRW